MSLIDEVSAFETISVLEDFENVGALPSPIVRKTCRFSGDSLWSGHGFCRAAIAIEVLDLLPNLGCRWMC